MSENIRTEQSYGCVAFCPKQGGRFLLVQHCGNTDESPFWGFPKGHAEPFEHKTETALRELAEETGLNPDEFAENMIFTDRYTFEDINKQKVKKIVTYFVAMFYEPRAAEINEEFSDEIAQAKWCTYDDACDKLHQSTCDVLKEAKLELSLNGLL